MSDLWDRPLRESIVTHPTPFQLTFLLARCHGRSPGQNGSEALSAGSGGGGRKKKCLGCRWKL